MARHAIILGIGSPFGADRLGLEAAAALQHHLRLRPFIPGRLDIKACDRPGASLLNHLRGAEFAVLVDAIIGRRPPGSIYRLEAGEAASAASPVSSHSLGLAETLALGEALGELPSRLVLYGVEVGEHWRTADGIPPAAFGDLLTAVVDEVCAYLR